MVNSVISPVPNNQPVIDKNGMISQIWAGFFNDLWARAGGSSAPNNNQLASTIASIVSTSPNTIVGNNTGLITEAIDLTPSQVMSMLPLFTTSLKGVAPASGGGTSNFLRADGTWNSPVSTIFDFFNSSSVVTSSSSITSGAFTTTSNSPGFTFTPNFSGKYRVYCSIPLSVSGVTSAQGAARIIKTSGTASLLAESQGLVSGPTAIISCESSVLVQSVYAMTAGLSSIFDIQAKVITGNSVLVDGANANFYMFAERVA